MIWFIVNIFQFFFKSSFRAHTVGTGTVLCIWSIHKYLHYIHYHHRHTIFQLLQLPKIKRLLSIKWRSRNISHSFATTCWMFDIEKCECNNNVGFMVVLFFVSRSPILYSYMKERILYFVFEIRMEMCNSFANFM